MIDPRCWMLEPQVPTQRYRLMFMAVVTVVSVFYVVWIEAMSDVWKGMRLGPILLNAREHYAEAQRKGRWDPALLYRGRWHHMLFPFYAVSNMFMAESVFHISNLPWPVLGSLGFGIAGGVAGHFLEYYGFLTDQNIPFGTSFGPVVFFVPSLLGMASVMLELVLNLGRASTLQVRALVFLIAVLSAAAEG
eukprot:gnl/MRDRNA2_/MRDRNA2_16158_c0_seq1.p1 gnl/MRDRNA2_/MRDRNA2_16158_c0~~gnl/MRDRNA2_/MRDRNA2_16158_c0_seq1.p1  ORF type:complete len:191 (-),score=19.62 gnl/MRDRNA2_/MRDRNA2_16158_c0_seq1:203-775(-)